MTLRQRLIAKRSTQAGRLYSPSCDGSSAVREVIWSFRLMTTGARRGKNTGEDQPGTSGRVDHLSFAAMRPLVSWIFNNNLASSRAEIVRNIEFAGGDIAELLLQEIGIHAF
jgi:hypothetical protein